MKATLFTICLFIIFGATLSAQVQDITTHEEYVARTLSALDRFSTVPDSSRVWLVTFLDEGCNCNLEETKEEKEACGERFFEKMGLPVTEEGYNNMDKKQMEKLKIISPLFNMIGRCPEHQP